MDTCNVTLGETSVSTHASDAVTNIATPRRGICPAGWHLPSETEVNAMRNVVGVSTASNAHEGGTGKLVTGCEWGRKTYDIPGLSAPVDFEYEYRNKSGLSLLPAGRSTDRYTEIGYYAYLWTSSYDGNSPENELRVSQWFIYGAHNYIHISASSTTQASYCASVRCVRD